ncbi:DUF427 domain-containing protein [Picosynechococcus sp. PCC 7117]|uniref:DUF427 domain-containing protein n=1 Tax=Picosynechococcus sp. PCC 7117 TaxID=195498 RepID=UPI0008105E4D|nr:DUF427 domain-containing protein [Picosynechococcus sp. PCC 7117]ANV89010.1 hypothetical protein AWQ22_15525 [Picosynechococcus sp. PCC 7117]
MRPIPIQPEPHQESVWDYPRPARLEDTAKHLIVICNQITIAETTGGKRVLETSHPPSYYFPAAAVQCQYLVPNLQRGICEWKGRYEYYDVVVGDRRLEAAAWRFFQPTPAFQDIENFYGFSAKGMDACYVNGEKVTPQAGNFYGGWITADIVGPFKGEVGTWGW